MDLTTILNAEGPSPRHGQGMSLIHTCRGFLLDRYLQL